MLAVVSVERRSNDASVIVLMDDELLESAIEIVRERNKMHEGHHCYVQQNVKYVNKESKMSIPQIIAHKQQVYRSLLKEISNRIDNAIGMDVKHNGRHGIIHVIYDDGTADVSFLNEDDGNEYMENLKMAELIRKY